MSIKNIILKIKKIVEINHLEYWLVFLFLFLALTWIMNTPSLLCPDGFFHTKMAMMIKDQGIIQNFPWTQYTTYNNFFVNQHFGYHIILIPFLLIPSPTNLDSFGLEIEPLIKTKLAAILLASLVFLTVYWLLKKWKVRKPFLYILILFLSNGFLMRISLTRAPAVSIIVLFLAIYFISRGKWRPLAIISFIYVWLYGAFPLLILAVIFYILGKLFYSILQNREKINARFLIKNIFSRPNIIILASVLSGIILGLTLNPYFPKTYYFHWFELTHIAIINYYAKIGVGAEWYPSDPTFFLVTNFPIILLWMVAVAYFASNAKKQSKKTWFLALLSFFFLLYTLKARRNIEYFAPLALIFSALVLDNLFRVANWPEIKNKIKNLFHGKSSAALFGTSLILIGIIGFGIKSFFDQSFLQIKNEYQKSLNESIPYTHLQKTTWWIKNNIPAKEIIYQQRWDTFPFLFYFDTEHYYINGLDQTFMYAFSKDLFEKWQKISQNKIGAQEISQIVKNDFRSFWFLLEKREFGSSYKPLKLKLDHSPFFFKTYEDEEAAVYNLR